MRKIRLRAVACQDSFPCSEVVTSQDTTVLSSASKEDLPLCGQALILPLLPLASRHRETQLVM